MLLSSDGISQTRALFRIYSNIFTFRNPMTYLWGQPISARTSQICLVSSCTEMYFQRVLKLAFINRILRFWFMWSLYTSIIFIPDLNTAKCLYDFKVAHSTHGSPHVYSVLIWGDFFKEWACWNEIKIHHVVNMKSHPEMFSFREKRKWAFSSMHLQ